MADRTRTSTPLAIVLVAALALAGLSGSGTQAAELPVVGVAAVDASLSTATGAVEVFVHDRAGIGPRAAAAVSSVGGDVLRIHREVGVVYARTSALQARALSLLPSVSYVEDAARPLRYFLETSGRAIRTAEIYSRPVTDPQGNLLDGRGIGIAVIDSGIDSTHPDLADRVVANYEVVCNCPTVGSVVPLPNSDEGGGHGTHVAGTVAGTGEASNGEIAGAARGASIYGLGVGAGIHVPQAVGGLQWVVDNHDKVDPPIRVVNNSWGSEGARSNPNDIVTKLTNTLISRGVVVVWAAGNDGGDGTTIRTNPYANNTTPGNISVANYDDGQQGKRNGTLSSSSSRGQADAPDTWPDVSAPGSRIMSTCRLTLPVCSMHLEPNRRYLNLYSGLSGTSMAAPHVAGVVAQLLQAAPSLTPGDVERALEATALHFTFGANYTLDPYHPGRYSSFDKGHGLVDAIAAVASVCASCGGL